MYVWTERNENKLQDHEAVLDLSLNFFFGKIF